MTAPGPPQLGRGVVIRPGDPVPDPWSTAPRIEIEPTILKDNARREELVTRLHRSWAAREPVVVVWNLDDRALAEAERTEAAPWTLDAGFLFPKERLRFLIFSNNYDARSGNLRWWWGHKAARRVGAREEGPADVVLADGTVAWIDGGPRRPVEGLPHPLVHGESIEAGTASVVPAHRPPADQDLAEDQLRAVAEPAGAVRVIAPAGSGKTRTLAARLHHLVADREIEPFSITAVAYNTRAADELRQRAGSVRGTVRTIHSLGWAILHEAHPDLTLIAEPEVRNLLGRMVEVPKRVNTDPLGPYLEALEEVRAGLASPEMVEADRDDVDGFAALFDRYRTELYRRGGVDHGEQVYGAIEALLRHPELRARWQARCRYLLVDEFQDLTPAYLLLLRLVASPQLQVFGVGDDDQVIYGYAGADPGFLIDYDSYFPGAALHALETNYRCPPPVVEAAATLLSYNRRRIDKVIRPGVDHSVDRALEVRLRPGAELAAEAAGTIEGWLAGGASPAEMAVLTRVNSALIPVKAALVERGLPTTDLLDAQSLQRTTLRALFAWMRLAQDPEAMTRRDLMEAVRRPARGLTGIARDTLTAARFDLERLAEFGERLDAKQADRWADFVDDLAAAARVAEKGDAAALLATLVEQVGLAGSARTLDAGRSNAARSSHLDDLVAVRRAAAVHSRLDDFHAWLLDVTAHPSQHDGVTLSSVHRVKGMEWPHVIVFGVDRGAMPHELATDTAEERRVFHVAITRGRIRSLVLSDAARPSRFLKELDGSAPRSKPAETKGRPAERGRSSRHVFVGDQVDLVGGYRGTVLAVNRNAVSVRLDQGAELIVPSRDILAVAASDAAPMGEPDPELVKRLKAWRRQTSQALGVPAYVVLHDSTVEAIAALKPDTERALLNVPGIGPAKIEQYGDDILALVAAAAEPSGP